MGRTIHLTSLGCPKNRVDAEWMLGSLVRDGWTVSLDPERADVLLVNTCSFIGPAKEESIEAILEMSQYKGESGRRLVVTGCLAERYGTELREELPEVDAFVGTGSFLRLGEILDGAPSDREDGPETYVGAQHVFPEGSAPRIQTTSPVSAFLKVSEGCNHRCAFCIIPKIRGRHESRSIEDLVREAAALVEGGAVELCLIAQDLTAYGRDLPTRATLAELLRELATVDGLEWIRLLYCYPNYVTGDLLDTIAEEPKVLKYVDMPLQHGSDRILRSMRRERSADSLRRLVAGIRRRIPNVALRSSFIVGFPGETDEDFAELCRFVEDLDLDHVGAFRYSREENTAADLLDGHVPERVVAGRWHRLMRLQRKVSRRKSEARIGTIEPVLVCGSRDDSRSFGRSRFQAPEIDGIVLLDRSLPEGSLVSARITGARDYDLEAEVLASTRLGTSGKRLDRVETRP